jgi:KDO2-lipid IV(A) lauroyltransferase
MVALYRPPRIAELDAFIRASRQHLGATELVPADGRGLRRVANTLRDGGVVGVLPDQEPLKDHGVFAPFFGMPALTMTLVGRLVRRYDPLVVFGVAIRTSSGRFLVRMSPAPADLGHPDPARAAAMLNQGVERVAREFPEQYTWSYRRFKTRPPEELAARATATV